MPNYTEKLTNPLTDQEFLEGMESGIFIKRPLHDGLVAFLYYTGVRISEALKMTREQFRMTPTQLYCDIGFRLKKRKPFKTDALPIPLDAPYVSCIEDCLIGLKPKDKVWAFTRRTGLNVCRRAGFHYCHYFRLSRVSNFQLDGFTTPQIKSWFGITATAIDYYTGKVDIQKMSEALRKKQ